jgi:spore coat protein CotH
MSIRLPGLILFIWVSAVACYRTVIIPEENPETGPAGLEVFDESIIHTIELTLSAEDWQAIIDEAAAYENVNPDRPYYHAQLRFDGKTMDNDIGIRLKGHISIQLSIGHSFPLKLDFNRYAKDQDLDGLKKLNLNNNFNGPPLTIVRDFVGYNAWKEFGVAASRTSFAHVTVNQENLGTYVMVEQVDGGFIKRHFEEPYGDLYKPEQISGTLEYRGSHISDYPDIGHKWPDESDHSSLLHALQVLNSGSPDEIGSVFDVESVLTYLAGNVALGIFDYYPITGHNYYLYEASPGRFSMLPWDMNGSLESMDLELCSPLQGLLSRRLLEDPDMEARYFEILSVFLMSAGSPDRIIARISTAQGLIGQEFPQEAFEGLRQAIFERFNWLQEQIGSTSTCLQLPEY